MTLAQRIRQEFDLEVPIELFFTNLDVRSLAKKIDILSGLKRVKAFGNEGNAKEFTI